MTYILVKMFSFLVVVFINIYFTHSWQLSTLNTFRHPNEHGEYGTDDIAEIKRKYVAEESSKWKYPSIVNLNQYIAKVS